MVDVITLAASERPQSGKGPARAARRDGMVPAVIYGNKLEPLAISVERKELERQIHVPGFFIRLVDVAIDGESHRVLPREVQFHPVSDVPLHVDFLRFSADRKIAVAVPVHFDNEEESPGLKRGGVLNIVRHEVEVLCTADNIPQIFEIDLTGLDIGDAVHASMITLPEGVVFTITDRDFTIASVAAPTVVAEEEEETEGEEGEEIEGEEGAAGEGEAGEGDGASGDDGGESKDEG
jgi:large subunit ribosomal protein L25